MMERADFMLKFMLNRARAAAGPLDGLMVAAQAGRAYDEFLNIRGRPPKEITPDEAMHAAAKLPLPSLRPIDDGAKTGRQMILEIIKPSRTEIGPFVIGAYFDAKHDGKCWFTNNGLKFYQEEIKAYIPLSEAIRL